MYLRRFVSPHGLPALAVAAVQVGLGAVIMLLAAPFVATSPVHLSWPVVPGVSAPGVAGTGPAYVWNTNVVASWGAISASTVTYLTPVVGLALGIAVPGEAVTWSEPAGALIVLAGIAISQGRVPARRTKSSVKAGTHGNCLSPVGRHRAPAPGPRPRRAG
ncbi:DMT family transporter [Streptomyces sp. MP131-18]|uniref:DMT family transporter n=1 Tax=Streptomyces sp. MP131-18 TaxID=1857892 RepID=UPI00097BCD1A|nr:DMT family transporter [Streptomyces sp. MP131-18]ONK11703.1 carboxylate/amino acid/amine transporter [Streptomyces sp. MP131-18]